MSADSPAKDQDKFVLRLPDGMRDRLKSAAEKNNRSMNAEIVSRLEESFRTDASKLKDKNEYNALGYFVSSLMTIAQYGRDFGEDVKIEVNISGGLKDALPSNEGTN